LAGFAPAFVGSARIVASAPAFIAKIKSRIDASERWFAR